MSVLPIAEQLAGMGYRVLSPEMRGYVTSANPESRLCYRISDLSSDILALADAAEVREFHLIGHDWGGLLGWYLAAHPQHRLASFTALAAPHPRAFLNSILTSRQIIYSWYMLFFQIPRLPEQLMLARNAAMLRGFLRDRGLPDANISEVCDRFLKDRRLLTGALNWYRAMPIDVVRTFSLGPSLVDTLYIYGDTDEFSAGKASDKTAHWVKGRYETSIIEGMDHWLPEKCASQVVKIFAKFRVH
jgi:pimeloyl-ACP methyl ester carboxylesterase